MDKTTCKHIIFSALGSLGDVYPYIAIAKQLEELGFHTSIATSLNHCPMIQAQGLNFLHVRPDLDGLENFDKELISKVMDEKNGSEYVLREIVLANLADSYADIYAHSESASLLVTHPLTYGAIVAARKRNIPFVATILAPTSMWSAFDPPSLPRAKNLPQIRQMFGPVVTKLMLQLIASQVYPWSKPYRDLQAQAGLSVDKANPFFEGQYSPVKNLALFSPLFGPSQPDWPLNVVATGFPFLEESAANPNFANDPSNPSEKRLLEFLEAGTKPIVFTLGSSAVMEAGSFYLDSIAISKSLGKRAVLLSGPAVLNRLPDPLPPGVIAFEYLPHAAVFPHASVVVHQGGIGTTAQSLRAGIPQLVMPYSHDQFDNANRVMRLGVGLSVSRKAYKREAGKLLARLLEPSYEKAASELGLKIQVEDGAKMAAQEIAKTAIYQGAK